MRQTALPVVGRLAKVIKDMETKFQTTFVIIKNN